MNNKINKVNKSIINWFCKFWKSKVCGIIKLNALWGILIFIIGEFFKCDSIMTFANCMCLPFVIMILLIVFYICVCGVYELVYSLLSYTEKVLFDKNRLFN